MGTISHLLTKVKGFIFSGSTANRRDETLSSQGIEGQHQGIFPRFFGKEVTRKRQRPEASPYEAEITDDEDDIPPFPQVHPAYNKRQRLDPLELEMAYRSQQDRYTTRGSGKDPAIEGLAKQPWQYDFRVRSGKKKVEIAGHSSSLMSSLNVGNTQGQQSQRTHHIPIQMSDNISKNEPCSSKGSGKQSKYLQQMSLTGPDTRKMNNNVEVITLDDDDDPPSKALTKYARPAAATPERRFGRSPVPNRIPRLCLPTNKVTKNKNRDTNTFSRYLGNISKKLIGTSVRSRESVRIQEKYKYQQLLQLYNVMDPAEKACVKAKVNIDQCEIAYNRFVPPSTDRTVAVRRNEPDLQNYQQPTPSYTGLFSKDKALLPRLFSTPASRETFNWVSPPSAVKPKAITYKGEPDVIDLEKEESKQKKQITISPISGRKNFTFSSPGSTSVGGNFSNLEEAFNVSGLLDVTTPFEIEDREDKSAEPGPSCSYRSGDDDDLSIIAEKIVNTSRSKSINSLALEQTSCRYVEKGWLDDSKSTWRENQRRRSGQIVENQRTLEVLKKESTLEKDIAERIRKKLTLTEIIVLEEPPKELPELDDEILEVIQYAKSRGRDNEELAQVRLPKDTISITRGDVKTLGPLQWLNDNIINTYMGLIVLRSKNEATFPSVYAFQTFFYPKLLKEGYSNSLKRWTRKDDIFAHDLIILPIHLGLHWCLACIDLRKKSIQYFDSMGSDNNKCLHTLLDYISREMKERKQMVLDKSEWTLENVKGIPQQQNGSDCGMFACKFAEYLSRDQRFTFTQENMPYYRDRMIYELIKQDLLYP